MEVKLEKLFFCYKLDVPPVLAEVDLSVGSGETAAIIGKSGSGKTTLLRMVNGLLRPQGGRVLLDGKPLDYTKISQARRTAGYVMQEAGLFPHLSVEENITLMARLDRWDPTRIQRRLGELLSLVNLEGSGLRERMPRALSGGQRQRAAIARALFLDPPLLLMDEPFAHLDSLLRKELEDEFNRINSKLRKTVILVTHDLGTACRLGKRILLLADGKIEQDAQAHEFIASPKTPLAKRFVDTIVKVS